MKILFVGAYDSNSGPANVNKRIIENLDSNYYYLKARCKVLKLVEIIWKVSLSKVVVVSALSKPGELAVKLALLFRKKVIYIMHGCFEFESHVNGFKGEEETIKLERFFMDSADKIVAVSRKFKIWLEEKYPYYNYKLEYIFNGVERYEGAVTGDAKVKGKIAVIGGDRKIKNNQVVSEAVELLNGKAELNVYGTIYFPETIMERKYTRYKGQISQVELHKELSKVQIFVLNSVFESFSLAVIEALNCGCSVLISNIAGVTDLLKLKECDVILNPNDKKEIASKIDYLLEHPNCDRLSEFIDYDKFSYVAQVSRITHICSEL